MLDIAALIVEEANRSKVQPPEVVVCRKSGDLSKVTDDDLDRWAKFKNQTAANLCHLTQDDTGRQYRLVTMIFEEVP